ncbi:MAG: NAD-dependent epimerase/dehydratase family protein [Spirochaetales bacterium]|nr:NAD-dependent epimerase/dehydratase family protein [Spirochaetales bacterium]
MKLLIIGGTGNISREITRQAVKLGHDVTLFNRGTRNDADTSGAKRIITGDRTVPGELEAKLKGLEFDAVVDMISFNENDAKATLDAIDGKACHIIFTSSCAVYNTPDRMLPISEDTATLRTDDSFPYGFHKANMERYIRSRKTEAQITIIRPSLTFGVGCQNIGILRQNANIARRIMEGKPLVMMGDGTNPWTFTFSPDLANAYVRSLCNPSTFGKTFHITSGFVNLWEDLYTTVGDIVGKEPKIVHAPADMLNKIDSTLFAHLNLEKKYFGIFDCSNFRKAVPEWKPQYDLRRGMEMICSWWKENGYPFDEKKDRLETAICDGIAKATEEIKAAYENI